MCVPPRETAKGDVISKSSIENVDHAYINNEESERERGGQAFKMCINTNELFSPCRSVRSLFPSKVAQPQPFQLTYLQLALSMNNP